MLCTFWDQEGPIYYELLKPGETVNTDRYKKLLLSLNDAILEKREQYKRRQHKVIFLDDNAPSHLAKPTRTSLRHSAGSPLRMRLIRQTLGSFRLTPISIIGTCKALVSQVRSKLRKKRIRFL
ncbi:mariner Mos1 transposase [Trichonephila clavipes]|nr:mariner Mos1 transposase [Trichonephila clavipes]